MDFIKISNLWILAIEKGEFYTEGIENIFKKIIPDIFFNMGHKKNTGHQMEKTKRKSLCHMS